MNSENDVLRDQLRALMNFRPLEVPEYWSNPVVAARVGRMLTDAAAQVPVRPAGVERAMLASTSRKSAP
jgi:formylmethanofuran dehydrogenase subunit E-like metal-binding protein